MDILDRFLKGLAGGFIRLALRHLPIGLLQTLDGFALPWPRDLSLFRFLTLLPLLSSRFGGL